MQSIAGRLLGKNHRFCPTRKEVRKVSMIEGFLRRFGRKETLPTPKQLAKEFEGATVINLSPYDPAKAAEKTEEPLAEVREGIIEIRHTGAYLGKGTKYTAYLQFGKAGGEEIVPLMNYQGEVVSGKLLRFSLPPSTELVEGEAKIYYKVGAGSIGGKAMPANQWVFKFSIL